MIVEGQHVRWAYMTYVQTLIFGLDAYMSIHISFEPQPNHPLSPLNVSKNPNFIRECILSLRSAFVAILVSIQEEGVVKKAWSGFGLQESVSNSH